MRPATKPSFTEERVGSRWLGGGTADFIDDLDTDDQLSLEVYGTTARHEINLTHDHQTLSENLDGVQASHYDSWTNMGGGLERAIEELSSSRARGMSIKMTFCLRTAGPTSPPTERPVTIPAPPPTR